MSEKKTIILAAVIGTVVLVLLLIAIRPFSKFESEYPMEAVSGSAVSTESSPGVREDKALTQTQTTSRQSEESVPGVG
ncbi:MAG: hypothetical protein IJS24_10205 [Eubacterium sp.]|nr:hypothetical protein [Eubacterium sp.]